MKNEEKNVWTTNQPLRDWHRLLVLASFSMAFGVSMAQSDGWVLGDQWVSLQDPNGQLIVNDLPTGADYNGQIAEHSQACRTDVDATLEFFIVDGYLYDNEGYLITAEFEDQGFSQCSQCIFEGIKDVLIIPVPYKCQVYFIIHVEEDFNNTIGHNRFYYSILDMLGENPEHPGRFGRLLNEDDLDDPRYAGMFDAEFIGSWDGSHQWLLDISTSPLKDGDVSITAMDPEWEDPNPNAGSLIMHITDEDRVWQFFATSTGIDLQWEHQLGVLNNSGTAYNMTTQFGRDAVSGEILFAFSRHIGVDDTDFPFGFFPMGYMRMDPDNATFLVQQGLNPGTQIAPSTSHDVVGLAFSPSGEHLYFTMRGEAPYIGVYEIDVDPAVLTDVTTLANIQPDLPAPQDFQLSTISPNVSPDGNDAALYFARSNGLSCLTGPDDPFTAGWVQNVPLSATVSIQGSAYPPYQVSLMPPQIINDTYLDDLQQSMQPDGYCCELIATQNGYNGHTFGNSNGQNEYWEIGSAIYQQFGNSDEVTFSDNLIVGSGARIVVEDMTLRFAPNARLIVQPGGYIRFSDCLLTSLECDGLRWPGIVVEGDRYDDQAPLIGGDQGYINLNGTTVQNAVLGALAGTYDEAYSDPDYGTYLDPDGTGGIIIAQNNSLFHNCITGVDIRRYHANILGNTERNRCRFVRTDFIVDEDWPDEATPNWQAFVHDTRWVEFIECGFANDAHSLFADESEWGGGILAVDAQVFVDGDNDPNESYIRGWQLGALVATMGLDNHCRVDQMHFNENVYGLTDFGSNNIEYINNTFNVPDIGTGLQPRLGMLLWQSQLYTVERNVFNGTGDFDGNMGIYFLGHAPGTEPYWTYVDNQIYDNDFNDLLVANLVQFIQRGDDFITEESGLSLFCGDYTNNVYDIAMLEQSLLKSNQGFPSLFNQQLSGNRFFDAAGCTMDFDWSLDPAWNLIPGWASGMTTAIYRHEDVLCDVQCDFWQDFADNEVAGSGDWVEGTCNGGDLDFTGGHQQLYSDYQTAKSLLEAAINAYEGNIDGGERPDLLAMLEEDPPIGSSILRDLLLANSPLSDEVLMTMIRRVVPLDPWHSTQVLLANVRLSKGIMGTIKELQYPSPFFYNIVEQANNGSGVTWKELMKQEIAQRRLEKVNALRPLSSIYASDSTLSGGMDSLQNFMLLDNDFDLTQMRTEYFIGAKDWEAAAFELEEVGMKLNGAATYTAIRDVGATNGGNWSEMSTTEADILLAHSTAGSAGAAYAAALLWQEDRARYLPPVWLPRNERSMLAGNGSQITAGQSPIQLAVYPNPATDEVYITWPIELKGESLVILDNLGREVLVHQANENGLSRLDLGELSPGVYQAAFINNALNISFVIK